MHYKEHKTGQVEGEGERVLLWGLLTAGLLEEVTGGLRLE